MKKTHICAEKELSASLVRPSFCVCIRLFRNVHAIIMGGLSYYSSIVELFSIFYFFHASVASVR